MTVETAIKEEQQKLQALKPGLGMLDSVLEDAEAIDLDLPVPENLHGDIEGILADRIESFIGGLLSPSATTTYNFVRDVSEAEFRRACAACSLSASDQRVSELWRLVENDSDDRGRVTVKDIFDLLALSDLEKLVAVFFLKMDIVDGSVRAESVQSALGGYMEDSQIDDLVSEVETLTFPQLRARIKALIDAQMQVDDDDIEQDRDDVVRMIETQISTAMSRMDKRERKQQVLLPRQHPYVVQDVTGLEEIELNQSLSQPSPPPPLPGSAAKRPPAGSRDAMQREAWGNT